MTSLPAFISGGSPQAHETLCANPVSLSQPRLTARMGVSSARMLPDATIWLMQISHTIAQHGPPHRISLARLFLSVEQTNGKFGVSRRRSATLCARRPKHNFVYFRNSCCYCISSNPRERLPRVREQLVLHCMANPLLPAGICRS